MVGDVLFWPSDGSLVSRAIALATHGPFPHCSVDLGDGTDIGAEMDGVKIRPLPNVTGLVRYRLPSGAVAADGIRFLRGELNNRYGYVDILNALLSLLHLPYRLTRLDRYDCSALVARYLVRCGVDLGDLGEEPDSVSPNDLARFLHLL